MKFFIGAVLALSFALVTGCGNPRINDPDFSARVPDAWQRDDIAGHIARFVPQKSGSAGYILVSEIKDSASQSPKVSAQKHFAAWRAITDNLSVEYYAERPTSIRYEAGYQRGGKRYIGYGIFAVAHGRTLAVIAAIEEEHWQRHRFAVQRFVESFRIKPQSPQK